MKTGLPIHLSASAPLVGSVLIGGFWVTADKDGSRRNGSLITSTNNTSQL